MAGVVSKDVVVGKIDEVRRREGTSERPHSFTVNVSDLRQLRAGDTVEVHKVLTDEDIGRRLRRMLTEPGAISAADLRRSVSTLAYELENEYGWPIVADLVRDVAGLEKR